MSRLLPRPAYAGCFRYWISPLAAYIGLLLPFFAFSSLDARIQNLLAVPPSAYYEWPLCHLVTISICSREGLSLQHLTARQL
jgi:hypothetical protein